MADAITKAHEITVMFRKERDTKNSVLFQEITLQGQKKEYGDQMVGALYVKKSTLEALGNPNEITVSIMAAR